MIAMWLPNDGGCCRAGWNAMDPLRDVIDWTVPIVEAAGATIVLAGLGLSLSLGLEFLLAADILRTSVSPTWEEIGQLAAIVGIRTALNFFLGREVVEGRRQIEALSSVDLNHGTIGPPHAAPRRRLGRAVRRAFAGPTWLVRTDETPPELGGSEQPRQPRRDTA
jgi:hypothetical protein